jgi:hypothetical protein
MENESLAIREVLEELRLTSPKAPYSFKHPNSTLHITGPVGRGMKGLIKHKSVHT